MGEATVVRDANKFRRWTFKVDAFIIFYYLTICKDNNKIRIVKIFSVCYIEMVHLKIKKAKVLERRKNVLQVV